MGHGGRAGGCPAGGCWRCLAALSSPFSAARNAKRPAVRPLENAGGSCAPVSLTGGLVGSADGAAWVRPCWGGVGEDCFDPSEGCSALDASCPPKSSAALAAAARVVTVCPGISGRCLTGVLTMMPAAVCSVKGWPIGSCIASLQ